MGLTCTGNAGGPSPIAAGSLLQLLTSTEQASAAPTSFLKANFSLFMEIPSVWLS
jgi:hypothetical protein